MGYVAKPRTSMIRRVWTWIWGAVVFFTSVQPVVAAELVKVVTTTTMIADLVRQVGGERVEVVALMGAGVDPHLYKATQGDLARLKRAEIVFFNGLHLEGKMGEVFEKLREGGKKRIVAVTDSVSRERLRKPAEFEGNFDPHIWFDVALWAEASRAVEDALRDIDPLHAAHYSQRAASYRDELGRLHGSVRERIQSIPPSQRVLITAHDAFGYFGQAYGIEVHGLQGISTATEYGLQDVARIVQLVVERKIRAIFVESSVPQKFVEAIQEGVRARGHEVRIGGTLYSDSMGTEGTPEATFVGMVNYNVDTIVKALS
jgi:manganese/zinc/iron transport system substrate-binding protein